MPSSAWQVDASLEKSGIVVTLEATPSHNFKNMVTTEGDRRTRTQKGAAAGQEKEEEEIAQQAPALGLPRVLRARKDTWWRLWS